MNISFDAKMIIVVVAIVCALVVLSFVLIQNETNRVINAEQRCIGACEYLNMKFLRVEDTSTYARWTKNCWCLDNGEPIDLGRIEGA